MKKAIAVVGNISRMAFKLIAMLIMLIIIIASYRAIKTSMNNIEANINSILELERQGF